MTNTADRNVAEKDVRQDLIFEETSDVTKHNSSCKNQVVCEKRSVCMMGEF